MRNRLTLTGVFGVWLAVTLAVMGQWTNRPSSTNSTTRYYYHGWGPGTLYATERDPYIREVTTGYLGMVQFLAYSNEVSNLIAQTQGDTNGAALAQLAVHAGSNLLDGTHGWAAASNALRADATAELNGYSNAAAATYATLAGLNAASNAAAADLNSYSGTVAAAYATLAGLNAASNAAAADIANGATAYGWGDHSTNNYGSTTSASNWASYYSGTSVVTIVGKSPDTNYVTLRYSDQWYTPARVLDLWYQSENERLRTTNEIFADYLRATQMYSEAFSLGGSNRTTWPLGVDLASENTWTARQIFEADENEFGSFQGASPSTSLVVRTHLVVEGSADATMPATLVMRQANNTNMFHVQYNPVLEDVVTLDKSLRVTGTVSATAFSGIGTGLTGVAEANLAAAVTTKLGQASSAYGWGDHGTNQYAHVYDDWTNTLGGVAANTVTQRAWQGSQAYGWGNHQAAGYITSTNARYSRLTIAEPSSIGTNLVTNGTFTGSADGWTLDTAYWYSNRVYVNAGQIGTVTPAPPLGLETGKTYWVTFSAVGDYPGTNLLQIGDDVVTCRGAGSFTNYLTPTLLNTGLVFAMKGSGVGGMYIDNVAIYEMSTGTFAAVDGYFQRLFVGENEVTWSGDEDDPNWAAHSNALVKLYATDFPVLSGRVDVAEGYTNRAANAVTGVVATTASVAEPFTIADGVLQQGTNTSALTAIETDPIYATGGVTRAGLTIAGDTTSTWDSATQTLTIYGDGNDGGSGGTTNAAEIGVAFTPTNTAGANVEAQLVSNDSLWTAQVATNAGLQAQISGITPGAGSQTPLTNTVNAAGYGLTSLGYLVISSNAAQTPVSNSVLIELRKVGTEWREYHTWTDGATTNATWWVL